MFTKAVHKHDSLAQIKGPARVGPLNQPLKPSPPSVLNGSSNPWQPPSNPLKRKSSQADDIGPSKGQERVLRTNMKELPSTGENLGRLPATFFFDENDFDDDKNIDLDNDEDFIYPNAASKNGGNAPTNSFTATSPSQPPVSSTPLPWSSSPLECIQVLPQGTSTKTESRPSIPKKRRIPWVTEQAAQQERDVPKKPGGMPDFVREIIDNTRKKREAEHLDEGTGSPYPWNKTASAVKEDQRKLRAHHKLHVKKNPAVEEQHAIKTTRPGLAKVFLSDEQKLVLRLVAEKGNSVFFTGSAGTGKSVLLREIIKELRDKFRREPDRVAVTASTGLAACNVGGVTLHSFAGIGLGKEAAHELARKVKRNAKAKNRWLRTKVLVIDEISMVDGDLFDKLEEVARIIRNNGRPFGGIQLVITGDFFQLPPVPDPGRSAKFSFDAATWNTSIEHTIGLTHVFRQKDPVFANMLNEMRLGKMTPESNNAFRALSRPLSFSDEFQATELFPTRIEVDSANNARMRNLGGPEYEFKAVDGGSMTDIAQRDKLLANCMAPVSIILKKGAQVMLIKNIDDTLVNGSVGRVLAFMDERTFDIYDEDEDQFQSSHSPIAKDKDISGSRQKLRDLIHNSDALASTSQKWPLVRFSLPDGSSRDLLCQCESWKIELPNGEVQASRSQVPLILAWALSIHKAQGQTLDRVKVDLGKIFEKGQAYVALSRATCQEGLQVTGFRPEKVMAHERVRTFYDGLYSVQQALETQVL